MELKELSKELKALDGHISEILEKTGFSENESLGEIEADRSNPENLLLLEEYSNILYKLQAIDNTLLYLSRPTTPAGRLEKQENGRFTLGNIELTCGNSLEVLIFDEYQERYKWLSSRIEHNGQDYYIVGYDGRPDGLKARIRK